MPFYGRTSETANERSGGVWRTSGGEHRGRRPLAHSRSRRGARQRLRKAVSVWAACGRPVACLLAACLKDACVAGVECGSQLALPGGLSGCGCPAEMRGVLGKAANGGRSQRRLGGPGRRLAEGSSKGARGQVVAVANGRRAGWRSWSRGSGIRGGAAVEQSRPATGWGIRGGLAGGPERERERLPCGAHRVAVAGERARRVGFAGPAR
jgi:hypothetical protein